MNNEATLTATTVDLSPLLAGIHSGAIMLPDFQRDFDWSEKDVIELLVTVFSGWPAGSLLIMRGHVRLFKLKPFEDAAAQEKSVDRIVLDGQQRLTSLYHALYDRGPTVYALKYPKGKHKMPDLEEGFVWFKREDWDRKFRDVSEQFREGLLPCYALKTPSDFFDWRDQLLAALPRAEQEEVRDHLTHLYRNAISVIHRYEFPVVMLEETIEPAAIARIFERVNQYGMTLGTFDLMVAKVYEPDWNLRDRWRAARDKSPILSDFLGEDGLPILQTIALRKKEDVRQKAVLALAKNVVHFEWDSSVRAVTEAFCFLEEVCGVRNKDWLPYRTMVLPLAALAVDNKLEERKSLLSTWFWNRTFSLAFDAAANTRIVSDYSELQKALDNGEQFTIYPGSRSVLREATRRRERALWSGMLCALAKNRAVDLLNDESEHSSSRTRSSREPMVPVSLFASRAWIGSEGDPPWHLRLVGFILATKTTSRIVRRGELVSRLEALKERHGEAAVNRRLETQFLPPYETFVFGLQEPSVIVDWRLDQIVDFIEREGRMKVFESLESGQ